MLGLFVVVTVTVVSLSLTCHLAPGQYTFSLGVSEPADHTSGAPPHVDRARFLDMAEGLGPMVVTLEPERPRRFYGRAELPLAAEVARCAP